MNIVYESYAHEPSDEICQNDISEESNSNEIADHDTMYITDNNDQQIFTNELNNEVCNLPNQLIDESCKNNEQLSKNENECFFSQVQMTVSDTEICGENVEDNLDIGMNETTSDVNRSEVSSQCNYIESRSTQSDILTPVDDIAEQMELMILNQLAQQNDNVEVVPDDLELYLDNQELLLNNYDSIPRQFEPPKEKPPPPPTEEAEPLQITVTSVARTNSTKRIKQEIQKRRSDFLGLEIHDDGIDIGNLFIFVKMYK
ncbi:uncharacterized protein LOC111612397 [Centruroides sculpturatus]|uniref:uncharacterized protein LOC111612397 n=1 Tax=Centruroides sculpturatus TaxID=218467 RepID=UPI000C6DC4DD|nr:uncharacterized protein LOC111612397 [Centruroides sculpturatus]